MALQPNQVLVIDDDEAAREILVELLGRIGFHAFASADGKAGLEWLAGAAAPPQGFQGQVDAALAHDARDRLGGIKAPTLVVHGALDQLSPLSNGEELARLIPGAELITLQDVGHAVTIEAQRTVNTALRKLWTRVP